MPYAVDNELTEAGRDLLMVGASLEAWLDEAPNGPIVLSSRSAKAAIRALIGGWAPAIVGQLAIRPQSLTELSAAIKGISYPSLERRLSAMRTARLVKALPENGPGTPYAVTGWTRRAVAILGAAGRWEHLWLDESVERSGPADVETAFMLVAPILELPTEICGSCQLKVTAGREPNERWLAGVHLEIDDGEVSSRAASSADDSTAWAAGAPEIWLDGMAYGHFDGLRFGGEESELATAVVRSLGVLSAGSGGD
jgi:DNA-binding HxlR family transcriptional regulator